MEHPYQDQPLDQKAVTVLVTFADQLEVAVKSGHEFTSAGLAKGIAQVLQRFSPAILTELIAEGSIVAGGRSFPDSPPGTISPPDPIHLTAVESAVARFKEDLRAGNLEAAVRALVVTGILVSDDSPEQEVRKLELDLARSSGVRRLSFLPRLAKLALWCGETDKATAYATEALDLEPPGDPTAEGEATHDGNMVLGLIALRRGDVEQSKVHLHHSVSSKMSIGMRMTGPNLTLASELLKKNEREAVVGYLQECKRFWAAGRETLDEWIDQINKGQNPEISPFFLCV